MILYTVEKIHSFLQTFIVLFATALYFPSCTSPPLPFRLPSATLSNLHLTNSLFQSIICITNHTLFHFSYCTTNRIRSFVTMTNWDLLKAQNRSLNLLLMRFSATEMMVLYKKLLSTQSILRLLMLSSNGLHEGFHNPSPWQAKNVLANLFRLL